MRRLYHSVTFVSKKKMPEQGFQASIDPDDIRLRSDSAQSKTSSFTISVLTPDVFLLAVSSNACLA